MPLWLMSVLSFFGFMAYTLIGNFIADSTNYGNALYPKTIDRFKRAAIVILWPLVLFIQVVAATFSKD